jgi:outer membrane protein assembly factor BamA
MTSTNALAGIRNRLAGAGVGLCALLLALALAPALPAGAQHIETPVAAAELVLEAVELEGATRTDLATALLYLPLAPGESVDSARLQDAVAELRASELFASVEFYTRPGSARGRVRLVLEVVEKGLEFRLGTGYQDLTGWYLIPAQLRFDNRLGRGEQLRLQLKFGYRVAGVELLFAEPRFGDGRNYWGWSAYSFGVSRLYSEAGIQIEHAVARGGLEVHVGRELASHWTLEVGARAERVDADSTAEVGEDDDVRGVEVGDEISFAELPPAVARSVGLTRRTVLHTQLTFDSRVPRQVAFTPAGGVWGRARFDAYLRDGGDHVSLTGDIRGYRALFGGVVAARARGGVIGREAAFYDRFYIGGLYTLRGVPGQSLSAPEGDTRFWSASLEFRGPLIGAPAKPRLSGLLFVDAGDSWSGRDPTWDDVAVSAGYGLRLRLPWIGLLGLDFGAPVTESPRNESYRAAISLGWTF